MGIRVYGIDYNPAGDSPNYDTIGYNLAQGHGYSLSQMPPFIGTTEREPTYPMFLALLYRLAGHRFLPVVVIQCFLGSISCLLIYAIVRNLYNDQRIAIVAAMANALYLPIAIFNLRIMSETTAILLMGIVAYNGVRLVTTNPNWTNTISLGLSTGLLILNKLAFQLLPLLLVFIILMCQGKRMIWKSFVFVILVMGIVAPWVILNKQINGHYALGDSVRLGASLYLRVANDGLPALPENLYLYGQVREREVGGVTARTFNAEYVGKALAIIREPPLRYLGGILPEILGLWRFGIDDKEIDATGATTLQGLKGKITRLLKHIFLASNFIVLLTGLWGFLMRLSKASGFVMALIGYSTLIAVLICYTMPRYNVLVLQLMLIFSSYWLVTVLDRVRGIDPHLVRVPS